ncbi:MAG: SNase-like protein nuclease [Candidatus Collierbacteria bacterium GW2011_GWA1_42_60]|uniref:SNase-like protein nuclease n=1 Tax=Candidatus Collierbacteria bacterium GW2011_GWA2_42_17 TaxID=1618378 RepID=A0A0G1BAA6_9BACT|nr:MAG: SNase-like protein nuclease [Candidatus Collierbacteria bacterium GW2011_GWB2_42_12]KKS43271.1 MAG: SNase-like protein nuclease [Candidatus Collierbacteria bacterium GW2011_GWA2_42_17]KKS62821.1 MAG: SNase-like protein nuclease [Candidatus Collierbacteria bacterium GW2011_GWE2_42_48]KKS63196.1 MAG: SNase-like protein nuclease [Candidatus Collierbacteria bacterium GW2011_GWD2_42_50]KKS65050.1 MAG: SNase-like protein nuclease [Candidatus Collierbacteria bacterium GW2011_GWF2_42_51]KKS674
MFKAISLHWKSFLLCIVVIIPSAILFWFYQQNSSVVYDKVVEVVDGDTFFIQNRQPIRLYGVNAPELGNCYSEESKNELTKLILGKEVRLTGLQADHYGRVVADVFLKDGTYINLHMVNGGFAVYIRAYDQNIEKMKEMGGIARQNKIGIFSTNCYQKEPENPKCKIKGTLDEKSLDRKFYLKPSCAYYDSVVVEKYLGEQWFCTEAEAIQAGFTKSPNCK